MKKRGLYKIACLLLIPVLIASCDEVSQEKRPLVDAINQKVSHIDANHRVRILEDDFHTGDSIYKVRGYFMDEYLLKLVGVLYTPRYERDDYFYFENHHPIFSGHLVVEKTSNTASEYKFYYSPEGKIEEALSWQDHYQVGKKFPHEHFSEFSPDTDSLKATEEQRLLFFLSKLDLEGIEIKHLNENLEANLDK